MAGLTLGTIKTRIKRQFGDESQVQLLDSDIVMWANDAQRLFLTKDPGIFETTATANAVAGTMEYTLPTDLFILDTIAYKTTAQTSYFPLLGKTIKDFDEFIAGWDGSFFGTGIPQIFHRFKNLARFYPIPAENSTNGIKYYYKRRPVDMVNDGDSPDVPEEYHQAIVDFVLQRAYFMDEDYEASQLIAQSVDQNLAYNAERRMVQNYYQTLTVMPEDSPDLM